MSGRRFVIGDIHGAFEALLQVVERANFNAQEDTLICLGDICDGWPQTKECVEYLLEIPNLILTLGNHDYCALKWMKGDDPGDTWAFQGGDATVTSYSGEPIDQHIKFLERSVPYFVLDNKLFVHAGIDPEIPLEEQTEKVFLWDRKLATIALNNLQDKTEKKLSPFDEIYIGHTPIHRYGYKEPINACEIWLMDTGAGWDGCLSMMNIDTKEVFTSDDIPTLYPEHSGRF